MRAGQVLWDLLDSMRASGREDEVAFGLTSSEVRFWVGSIGWGCGRRRLTSTHLPPSHPQ